MAENCRTTSTEVVPFVLCPPYGWGSKYAPVYSLLPDEKSRKQPQAGRGLVPVPVLLWVRNFLARLPLMPVGKKTDATKLLNQISALSRLGFSVDLIRQRCFLLLGLFYGAFNLIFALNLPEATVWGKVIFVQIKHNPQTNLYSLYVGDVRKCVVS